ncbi:hypothetical protein [Paenibacillus sp. FSL R5-0519]|uniref:hypothetical protein n=1 Tax=Paenibacillus sp. FSL R5-0519 TaxID=2921648 RepID=UPI0030D91DDB
MRNLETELIQSHQALFGDYFMEEEEANNFILEKLNYSQSLVPRRMLNTAQRLITLSDEIDIIRPGRRDLSIFFLITCIESLYGFIPAVKLKKQEIAIHFFENYFNQDDKKIIQESITISGINDEVYYKEEISMSEFALLMTAIRNNVAHEGVYWTFHFNEEDYDGRTLNLVKSKLKKDEGYNQITYEVGLTYRQFRNACIRACISLINDQFQKIKDSSL